MRSEAGADGVGETIIGDADECRSCQYDGRMEDAVRGEATVGVVAALCGEVDAFEVGGGAAGMAGVCGGEHAAAGATEALCCTDDAWGNGSSAAFVAGDSSDDAASGGHAATVCEKDDAWSAGGGIWGVEG